MNARPRLTTDSLGHRYPGGFTLGPVRLDLGTGIHHLRGENGAGKTTLLRILCGALRPLRGAVRLGPDGGDPVHDHRARRHIAWLPAEGDLPPFFSVDEAWQSAAALRGDPGWDGRTRRDALRLPGGLRLSAASAGQQKKAGWLATLAADPGVLLLDEPFANLDAESVALTAGWLEDLRATRVVVLISHEAPPLPVDSAARLARGAPLDWAASA